MNFYNEIDSYCCDRLEALICAKLIPDGVVDRRDIRDIAPRELSGYAQCHFFAGIGGWPLALARAGVDPDEPLWTGSCPCQPFSNAGKKAGFSDARHLWPVWFKLIKACRPPLIFGEQVASAKEWLYKVKFDLEHVSMSDAGREALYDLQTNKAFAGLSYLSWPWLVRSAALVQDLPKEVRSEVAECIKRKAKSGEGEEAREGQSVPLQMDGQEPGSVSDSRVPSSMCSEEHSLRSAFVGAGDRRADQEGSLRGDGIPAASEGGQRPTTQQRVSGQDQREAGVFLQKHSSGVFGSQHGFEQLERRGGPADHKNVGRPINGQQDFAGTVGTESSREPERERLVRGDLEALGYAVGAIPVEAASAGADHLRDRFWFVADANSERWKARADDLQPGEPVTGTRSAIADVADADFARSQGRIVLPERAGERIAGPDGLADTYEPGAREGRQQRGGAGRDQEACAVGYGASQPEREPHHQGDALTTGGEAWRLSGGASDHLEWVIGADGKARRVKPGIRLLAHGVPARVAKLRAFGNAIDPRPAAEFIRAALGR